MGLSKQDHEDLNLIAVLTAKALEALHSFERRHGLDLIAPALDALTRAEVSLEFIPLELQQAEKYLGAVKE